MCLRFLVRMRVRVRDCLGLCLQMCTCVHFCVFYQSCSRFSVCWWIFVVNVAQSNGQFQDPGGSRSNFDLNDSESRYRKLYLSKNFRGREFEQQIRRPSLFTDRNTSMLLQTKAAWLNGLWSIWQGFKDSAPIKNALSSLKLTNKQNNERRAKPISWGVCLVSRLVCLSISGFGPKSSRRRYSFSFERICSEYLQY